MDGDPRDACSLAAYVALKCTKVPKLEYFLSENGAIEDFELCGDMGDAILLECGKIPIIITVLQVSFSHVIYDLTMC